MSPIPVTPLEAQIAGHIGLAAGAALTLPALHAWQLERLNHTIAYARERSPFYRRKLAEIPRQPLSSPGDLATLPFTTAEEIQADPLRLLCVSQDEIARVVTLRTSGTTRAPKRLFFTQSDLERTIDFFHHGMSTLVEPGWRVLILMPGILPGSVGDLLVKGLARMGVEGIVHGLVTDPAAALEQVVREKIDALVGIPVQVLSMARHEQGAEAGRGRIRSVLLSTDYVPRAIVAAVQQAWDCAVFNHYGMTEMGLGGGVECRALAGCHLRESDLYFEIVDPDTGVPLPDGAWGEGVFTTLNRRGMPLIRYRTGDRARMIPEPCPCGSVLRRMAPVTGRIDDRLRLANGAMLARPLLDEAILAHPAVLDYQVEITRRADGCQMALTLLPVGDPPETLVQEVCRAVQSAAGLAGAFQEQALHISTIRLTRCLPRGGSTAKRRLMENEGERPT